MLSSNLVHNALHARAFLHINTELSQQLILCPSILHSVIEILLPWDTRAFFCTDLVTVGYPCVYCTDLVTVGTRVFIALISLPWDTHVFTALISLPWDTLVFIALISLPWETHVFIALSSPCNCLHDECDDDDNM